MSARAIRVAVTAAAALLATACNGVDRRSSKRADTAVAAAPRGSSSAASTDYVGLHYDVLPDGFHFESGAVIPPASGAAAGTFDFSHVKTPRGDMVWLDTLGAATEHGLPNRIVRAELRVPPLADDERLFMGSCDVGGKVDARVVAIAVPTSGSDRGALVRQAWRANPTASRFDLIPVTGISCDEPES